METKCLCGATATEPFGSKNGGTVARCTTCRLLRRIDYDETYEQLYTTGVRYHEELQLEIGHTSYFERFEHDLGVAGLRMPRLFEEYTLMDVGCANGAFIQYAKNLGIRAMGIEPNLEIGLRASQRTGARVWQSWDKVPSVYNFDIITYHDVIEHVRDPQREVDIAAARLNLGGLLILDTPDAEDPAFAEKGIEWHHFRPEQHLWFFREFDLRKVCSYAGLTVTSVDRPIPGKLVIYARKN